MLKFRIFRSVGLHSISAPIATSLWVELDLVTLSECNASAQRQHWGGTWHEACDLPPCLRGSAEPQEQVTGHGRKMVNFCSVLDLHHSSWVSGLLCNDVLPLIIDLSLQTKKDTTDLNAQLLVVVNTGLQLTIVVQEVLNCVTHLIICRDLALPCPQIFLGHMIVSEDCTLHHYVDELCLHQLDQYFSLPHRFWSVLIRVSEFNEIP